MEGIIGYSTAPLKIATVLGSFTSLLAVIYFIVVVLQRLICGVDVPGYATIVALILLIGGIQLLILGIMGEYIARMYIQGKQRPIFIEKLKQYKKDRQVKMEIKVIIAAHKQSFYLPVQVFHPDVDNFRKRGQYF